MLTEERVFGILAGNQISVPAMRQHPGTGTQKVSSDMQLDFNTPSSPLRKASTAIPPEQEPSCDCVYSEVRRFTQSNRVEIFVRQCLTCGRNLGAVSKAKLNGQQDAVRERFDESLRQLWQDRLNLYHRQRRETLQRDHEERTSEWWQRYKAYLLTDQWKRKRDKILERDNYLCRGCLSRRAVTAHHLTYEHMGNELLFELIAVCPVCHDQCHPVKD